MKNKKPTVFILLFLCVVIWGTIGWKVYSAFQDDSPIVAQMPVKNNEVEKDTIALLLNYRDPFLGDNADFEEEEEYPVAQEIMAETYVAPPEEILPDFQYKGIIRLGKKTQAIVNRGGQTLMLVAKDKVGEFTIVQITDEKLTVSRKNKKYELLIQ